MPKNTVISEEQDVQTYLHECCKIEPLAIQEEYVRIPSDLAYWNARYATALRRFLMAKIDVEVTRARLIPEVRDALQQAGGKVTESQVEALIDANDLYIQARRDFVDAEVEKNELYGALDAIRSKKEMLVSLGAHLRAELQGDPSLRDQARGWRERKDESNGG